MAGSELEGLDFDAFYTDFGVKASFAGSSILGLYNTEELETDAISGVYPTFRCKTRIDEGSTIVIDGINYNVESVLNLEFGEFLHVLSNDT